MTTDVAAVVDATAGPDTSSVRVPAVLISACANGPALALPTVKPSVVAPGVPVSEVALNVTYWALFTPSATLSTTVVSAAAVAELLGNTADAP